ncbi:MAG: SDR family oxidoreductase [Clostridiales bacterium]|nr:SDR family oxidoreductase [Clostridiales bacterium]MDY4172536.1 SDR family oxidoreductase [Evtepia sp.]
MGSLDGKIAVITGCSGGLGKQIALRFAREGASLAICARSADKLATTAKECESLGAKVLSKPVDLTDQAQLEGFVKDIITTFGTIDVLVNNAVSISSPHSFLDHTEEELTTTWTSGFLATWRMMRLCFPYLKGKSSSIINFGSGSGDLGMEGYAAYASTKEAIRGLSRVAAREWGQYGIRVNILSPSAVTENVTAGLCALSDAEKQYVKDSLSQNPLRRPGDPYEDITPAAVFLASDASRWITGQNLNVEGGGNIHA